MALNLTDDQKALGKANFAEATGELTRRGFMKSMVVAGGAVAVAGPAAYFGYQSLRGKPVKAAIIGTGDEGGVLVGEHNPEFLEIIAVCDIRPTNVQRIFKGEGPTSLRKGLMHHYGADCEKSIKYFSDYRKMLAEVKDIEAVVIATPLISHAPIAIDCLKAGKHVLCEKLMARTIGQCKDMIIAAADANRILSIGHQRHYSMLYAQATELLNSEMLGDIKHIRALWHRNNTWPRIDGSKLKYDPDTGAPIVVEGKVVIDPQTNRAVIRDGWWPAIPAEDAKALENDIRKYGYKSIDELVRWRLYNRTGGGLMAELGSHQLDACSIFLGKVKPLSVVGVGTHCFYGHDLSDGKPNPREIDDHVFVTFEFPGKNHPQGPNQGQDKNDVVVVTYSSISTNQFEPYGECIFGSRGTMLVEMEQSVMLYTEKDPNKRWTTAPKATTATVSSGNKPVLEAGPTWGGPAAAAAPTSTLTAPVSRGYREEMEDFAYCVRMWDQGMSQDRRRPRCTGELAMADAIIALTANRAMEKRERIEFAKEWFDFKSKAVPDGDVNLEIL
jgi:predicted dehydrogenase